MSQIRVHVGAPGEIVVPDTGAITQPTQFVPDGGNNSLYYSGLGIMVTIVLVAILSVCFIKRWKKKDLLRANLTLRILILAILSFGLTFAALSFSKENNKSVVAVGELAVSANDVDIYVELEDEPVYKSVANAITVNGATKVGYTLSAYVSSSDLISENNNKISGINTAGLTVLNDNTWGISLASPENENAEVWQSLPTNAKNPIVLKSITSASFAGDQTTVYYGVYVSPDTPAGTYTTTINYDAKANLIMQEVGEWGKFVEEGQEVDAIDIRDGSRYSVARLKDGKLWMTQNLDLGRTDLAVDLTSENTNLANTIAATTFNSWKKTSSTNTFDDGEFVPQDGMDETSQNSYGTLYNFYAASVGTISGPENTGNAQYDICPAGWRLPTGGASGEFQALYEIEDYDSSEKMRAPVSEGGAAFTLSNVSFGAYWSSTRVSDTGISGDKTNMWSLRIDQSNVKPTHSHQRRYTISIRCIAREYFNIIYDGNAGSNSDKSNVVTGDMTAFNHTHVESGSSITLNAPMYDRSNYGFAGWSLDPEAGTKLNGSEVPIVYGPNETITVSEELFQGTHDVTLYAVWVPKSTDYTMQTFSALNHSDQPIGHIIALEDERDGIVYTVAKLDDGNYWMVENLRTNLKTANITTTNTNNPTSTFSDNQPDMTNTSDWCGTICPNKLLWYEDNYSTGYGNYYSWTASVAGNKASTNNSDNAVGDICPVGWHIPTGGNIDNNGEYATLAVAYGGTGYEQNANNGGADVVKHFVAYPANFVRSGLLSDGKVQNRQNDTDYPWFVAYYWTSTKRGENTAYRLNFGVSPITPGTTDNQHYIGMAVRCVADSSYTIVYNGNEGSNNDFSNAVSGNMASFTHFNIRNGDIVNLHASAYTRHNYSFAGWSEDPEAGNKINSTNAPKIYGPNEAITITSEMFSNRTKMILYAVWVPASTTYTTINDLEYMQDFNGLSTEDKASVLNSMTEGEQYYLKDSRDNNIYRISKLKDGNVWMTQTLSLNLADYIGTHNLTPANTNLVSDAAIARGYWDPGETVQNKINTYSDELDARNLTHDFTGLSTLIIGQTQPRQYLSSEQTGYTWGSIIKDDGSFEAYAYNSNSNNNSYTEIPRSYSGENTISYNWYAATAESGTLAMTSGNAEDSICPAGWQIPYGTEENHSWYNLFINAYGLEANTEESATAIQDAPFYLSFEGGYNWNTGVQNTSGTDGYYHTATARENNVMFAVVHNKTDWVGTYGNGGKNGGSAIRCVTR